MPEELPRKRRSTIAMALRVVLGLVFLTVGLTKVTGVGNTVGYFAAIGWGQWLRYLTGVLDIAGSVLLFGPRRTFYGAIVLTCSVGLGAVLSFTVLRGNPAWNSPGAILAPLLLTLLSAVLAFLTRPHRPR